MKLLYYALLVVAVVLIAVGFFGQNIRWLIFVGVAVILVATIFSPSRPFLGRLKTRK